MSQHVVVDGDKKFVFGWDQPLQSYFLQVHDTTRSEEEQIVAWLGADLATVMYEVGDLARAARAWGLLIDHPMRVTLYGEKDDGI